MAPILSKFIKLKSGQKVPINPSNVKAVIKLSKPPKSRKIPVKNVPRPGRDRDLAENNDPELQNLLDEAEKRREARGIPVNGPQNDPNRPQNGPEIDQNGPNIDQNGPEIDQNGPIIDQNGPEIDQNGPENDPNIFNEDIDPFLEPNLELADITLAQRAQILTYPGTDKCKRSTFYLEYYPDFWHYYELMDCWDECPIKSTYLPYL